MPGLAALTGLEFRIPIEPTAEPAAEVMKAMLDGDTEIRHVLLQGTLRPGRTLGPPPR